MSKARDKQRKDARTRVKRRRKEAQTAQYQSWTEEGRNSKSKRARAQNKSSRGILRVRDHNSKNVGDALDYPDLNLPFLVRMLTLHRQGVRNQWTSKYYKQVAAYIEAQKK